MIQEIQKYDYDRYLSLLFCLKEVRADLEAVILFNLEIARIKSKVTEQMMGMIRLQWWREALDEIFDLSRTPRRHNVVDRLRILVSGHKKISKDDFLTVINAREKDLDSEPFKTEIELNEYLFSTAYPINKIMLDILKVDNKDIILAVQQISSAWASCAVIRSTYKNFSANRSVFPVELMGKYNLSISDFGRAEFVEISKPLVEELCNAAQIRLDKATELLKNVPKAEKKMAAPVLLNLKTTQNHLKQIKKNRYDVFTRTINPYLGAAGLVSLYFKTSTGNF